jgi:hypothetical protein
MATDLQNKNNTDLFWKFLFAPESRNWVLHTRSTYPGQRQLQAFIAELFSADNSDAEGSIVYKQWVHHAYMDISNVMQICSPVLKLFAYEQQTWQKLTGTFLHFSIANALKVSKKFEAHRRL